MEVPEPARKAAALSLRLKKAGYDGGTDTGFKRARQLVGGQVDDKTVHVMHAWFARHRFTSHPGYVRWVQAGSPTSPKWPGKHDSRGAVAWLLWGGDPAYKWIQTQGEVRLTELGIAFNPLPPLANIYSRQKSPNPDGQTKKSPSRVRRSPKSKSPRRRRSCSCSG